MQAPLIDPGVTLELRPAERLRRMAVCSGGFGRSYWHVPSKSSFSASRPLSPSGISVPSDPATT